MRALAAAVTIDLRDWAAQLAAAGRDPEKGVHRASQLCVDTLDVSGVSVSVTSASGVPTTLHATDSTAALIEELQFTLGEGPRVDAVNTGVAVLVPDLRAPADLAVSRWSTFLSQADEVGVRAVFSFPLRVGAIRFGAVGHYRDAPGPLTKDALTACWIAADTITTFLLSGDLGGTAGADADGLGGGYEREVHQATGMVQVQLDVTTSEALLRLRARAYAEGRPLRELAQDVVARRLRFTPEEGS